MIIINNCKKSFVCSVYLGSYFRLKKYDYSSFFAGGIEGVINWTITYPIDVIKSRQITHDISLKNVFIMEHYGKGY